MTARGRKQPNNHIYTKMNSHCFRLSNHIDTILGRNSINNVVELTANYQESPFTRSSLLHKGKRYIDKNKSRTYVVHITEGGKHSNHKYGIQTVCDVNEAPCHGTVEWKHQELHKSLPSAQDVHEKSHHEKFSYVGEHSGKRQNYCERLCLNGLEAKHFPGFKTKQTETSLDTLELHGNGLTDVGDPVLRILQGTMDDVEERENAGKVENKGRRSRSVIKMRHSLHLPSADDIRQHFRDITKLRPGSFRSPQRKNKSNPDEDAKTRSILKIRNFARFRRLSSFPRMNLHESIMSHNAESDVDTPSTNVDIGLSDLVFPDHTGWLVDQANGETVWGIVSDMLFCVFKNEREERPSNVIVLPGCGVRALVFTCPKENGFFQSGSASKTVSGVDKYQFIIDDKSLKTKHLFSVEKKKDLDKWVSAIQKAASLEIQAEFNTSVKHCRRDSVDSGTSLSSYSEDTLLYDSPRYVPSSHNSKRLDIKQSDQTTSLGECHNSVNSLPVAIHLRGLGNPLSLSSPSSDSIGEFRRKLRKNEVETEPKAIPLKAKHSENTPVTSRKMKSSSKLKRSFGSLDNLFRIKKKAEHENRRDNNFRHSANFDANSIDSEEEMKIPKREKSRSLDFGKSSQAFGQVVRRASDLKDKMFPSRDKSKNGRVRLNDLSDVKHSGYLHYKSGMKWTKLFCVVCGGCFYCYKSDSDKDSPQMAINLSNCEVCYVTEIEKRHKRLYVFRLSQSGAEDIYLHAKDKSELVQWLHALQMAANKITAEDGFIFTSTQNDDSWSVDSAFSSPGLATSFGNSRSLFNQPSSLMSSRTSHLEDTELNSASLRDTTDEALSISNGRSSFSRFDQEDSDMAADKCFPSPDGAKSYSEDISSRLDKAVFNSWKNDKGHLFQILRAKLNGYRKKKDNIYDKHLPGPNGDGLLVQMDGTIKRTIDEEIHKQKSHRKEIRRSKSLKSAMETTNGSSESDGLDETVESRVFRKRRRPFAVKKIASRDLKNPDVSGYMERRGFNGKWTKYWFILIDGCLYCYLTPDDRLTADVVNLHGHSVSTLEDKIRGRKFIVQLLHEEYTTLSLSVESREEMVSWFEELKQGIEKSKEQLRRAVDEKRNSEEKDVNSHMSVTELQDKYNELKCSVKQKLLEEVLRQKDELERKQAVRNKHQSVDVSMDSPRLSSTLPHSHDEQRLSDMTRLTQRRMSAQIKVETIQKQLGSSNHNKKSLFHFGHKKKAEDDQRGHLQEQLQELTSRLNDIDKSLKTCKSDDGCCGSCDQKNIYPLPQRAFSYNGQNGHSESDSVQRDTHRTHHGWKASVQSFAKKTLYKSKKHKTTVEVADGASGGSMSDSDSLDESLSDRVDGGAVIDLTMKPHRSVETSRSLDFSRSGDSCKPKNGSLKNNSSEFQKHRKEVESPKRQIAPSVMAEIDGFEEFAKQMLDKSGASKR